MGLTNAPATTANTSAIGSPNTVIVPTPKGILKKKFRLSSADTLYWNQAAARREVPSVDLIKRHLRPGVEPNTSLFHTGGQVSNNFLWAVLKQERAKTGYLKGYRPLCTHIHRLRFEGCDWTKLYECQRQFWCNLSRAFAELSSGTIYVLLPPGNYREFPPNGHFVQDEWPNMGHADRVVRINAKDDTWQVIWNRQEELKLLMEISCGSGSTLSESMETHSGTGTMEVRSLARQARDSRTQSVRGTMDFEPPRA